MTGNHMTVPKEPEIEIPDFVEPTRCGAKLRGQPGKKCRKRPLNGASRCRLHGGLNCGKPSKRASEAALERGRFVDKSLLPEIVAHVNKLKTVEGRALDALCRAAEIKKRAEALANNAETLPLFLEADKAQSRDIGQAHEFEKKDAPPAQAPVLVINTHQDANQSFMGRASDGSQCLIQPVGERLYMLDETTGALWPVVKQLDKDTGAEIFVKMLSVSAE